MPSFNSTRKWKTLVHKVEYLRLEIEEKKEVLSSVEEEFNRSFNERLRELEPDLADKKQENKSKDLSTEFAPEVDVVDRSNIPPSDDNLNDVESSNVKGDQEDFKKLWKLIAAKTHPDKTGGDQELSAMYQEAQKAWQDGNYEVLIEIAEHLSIKVPSPNESMIGVLQNRASSLQDELKKFESSILWDWSQASEEKRKAIIDHLIKFRKMKYSK